jgi:hypothetical protein
VTRYEVLVDRPSQLAEGAVLDICIRRLEREIQARPAEWLWTHKRWKHRRPADLPLHDPVKPQPGAAAAIDHGTAR